MSKRVVIFGERASGTKYLLALLTTNFDCTIVSPNHKHFFGHADLSAYRDALFICIVRAPLPWLNSFYKTPWHLLPENVRTPDLFLRTPVRSYPQDIVENAATGRRMVKCTGSVSNPECLDDRHMDTNQPYGNILKLRNRKLRFMLDDLPKIVPRVLHIRYEDLLHSFTNVMGMIKNSGLHPRHTGPPINITKKVGDCKSGVCVSNIPAQPLAVPKDNKISIGMIASHPDFDPRLEARLGYSLQTTSIGGLGFFPLRPAQAATPSKSVAPVSTSTV